MTEPRWWTAVAVVVAAGCGELLDIRDPTAAAGGDGPDGGGTDSSTTAGCAEPPPGLVAWWRGESSAADALLTNHGTLQQGAGFAQGSVGRGFFLDGIDDHVVVDRGGALYPKTSFAIEAWIRPTRVAGGRQNVVTMYECGGPSCDSQSWIELRIGDTSRVELELRDAGGQAQSLAAAVPLVAGAAVHVVAVRDIAANELALYLGGALSSAAELTVTGPLEAGTLDSDPLVIGATINYMNPVPANHFGGVVDEVSVYDGRLGAPDAALLHAAGALGKCW